jgi:hypothetical protein
MKLGGHGRCCEARNVARELKRARNWICIDGTTKTIHEVPLISGFGVVVLRRARSLSYLNRSYEEIRNDI